MNKNKLFFLLLHLGHRELSRTRTPTAGKQENCVNGIDPAATTQFLLLLVGGGWWC